MSDGANWFNAVMSPQLSQEEKVLRNKFVDEYLVDFNELRAALRCGFNIRWAEEYAHRFMQEPYVLCRINERREELDYLDKRVASPLKKHLFNLMLTEAKVQGGTQAARVSAIGRLMSVMGMDAPVQSEVTHKGGVMLVPAPPKSLDDWEKEAMDSQQKLLTDARTAV